MNKYSKRALKTTATVGMSLAMVLGAVNAPVMAATVMSSCETSDANKFSDFFADILTEEVIAVMNADTKLDTRKLDVGSFTVATETDAFSTGFKDLMVGATINCSGSVRDTAKKVSKIHESVAKANTLAAKYTALTEESATTAVDMDDYLDLIDLYATYADNLTDAEATEVADVLSVLDTIMNGNGSEYEKSLTTYVKTLDKNLKKFIKDNEDDGITKAEVNAVVKAIKDGNEYKRFKAEDAVISVLDEYDTMLDEIANIASVVNTKTNDAYAAYVKGTNSVRKTIKAFTDLDAKGNNDTDMLPNLSTADYDLLKAFKEEVVDYVWTAESTKYANRYSESVKKSVYATTAQGTTVAADFNSTVLFGEFDNETGEFGWDLLVKHMDKVNASLTAIGKDLDKLDSISLQASDRAAILAADEAVYFLQGDAAGNLTSAQTRTVKNAERKVTELMDTYRTKFGSINAELNGWVSKGDGNYAYYENGIAPAYKWVAAGSDWYFVRDGKMARNTWLAANSTDWYYLGNDGKMATSVSVDGCWINSLGIYRK